MAAQIYLTGGPCNGRTVSSDRIEGDLVAYIACGGGYYVVDGTKRRPNGDLIFRYWGTTKPGPPAGPGLNGPQALSGWKALRKSINRGMPDAIRYSQRGTRAALRSLSRARRVKF